MKNKPIACIQVQQADNVAIATGDIIKGTEVREGLLALSSVPAGHKISLCPIEKGSNIFRYGVSIGKALSDIPKGTWIQEHMLSMPPAPLLSGLTFATAPRVPLPTAPCLTWEGYPLGDKGGSRNLLGIVATVFCVSGVLRLAVDQIRSQLLPRFPHVDGVVAVTHSYGCGVAIAAEDAKIPIGAIKNIAKNPNFGGEPLFVGLGCEKLRPEMLCDTLNDENLVMLQDYDGFALGLAAILKAAEKKLEKLNQRRRKTLPLSALTVGLQCGGSDAFSGVSANPAIGYAADLLVSGGATLFFSENTEVRDGAAYLAARCSDESVGKRLAEELNWYDQYLAKGGVDRSANTTPGNKKGGLSNIVEKALGSIVKSGTSPITQILSPGELPCKQGMVYESGPANDGVCGTMQFASGMVLQVFSTGRGNPYGLAAAPIIKVASNSMLAEKWKDIIDIDTGTIVTGEATVEDVGEIMFQTILDVASGRQTTWAEKWNIHNDMHVFNPAPLT